MEQTQLAVESEEKILQNINEAKQIVEKQTKIFENILMEKILENFKDMTRERLQDVFAKIFTAHITEEINSLFKHYEESEIEFFNKNLKTADLIFDSKTENRTKVIYLENIIKKINHKEMENIENIFNESSREKYNKDQEDEEDIEYLSIYTTFSRIVKIVIKNPRLSIDESNDLYAIATHYYELYKSDVKLAIEHLQDSNKEMAITLIEEEMDNREIRNGKSSALSRIERSITNNSLKVMDQLLEKTIDKNKEIAKNDLKTCSSAMIDLIFRLLPFEFQDQKDLLEIIVDTNINERLGKLMDTETKKISINLKAKNEDIIENELYEEKRYKQIDNYECNFDLVGKVYQDVLHEIRIAYDIPEDNQQSKRLNLVVLSESNSTKQVFMNLVNNINNENQKNLSLVTTEMNNLSQKENNQLLENKQASSGPKK